MCIPIIDMLCKVTDQSYDFESICSDIGINPKNAISMDIGFQKGGDKKLMFIVTDKDFKTNFGELLSSVDESSRLEIIKQSEFTIWCGRSYYQPRQQLHGDIFQKLAARLIEKGGNLIHIYHLKVDNKTTQFYITDDGPRASLDVLDIKKQKL